MDCVLSWSEVDLGLPHFLSIYTRDMMDRGEDTLHHIPRINTLKNVVTQD
jgi:hypothetical protein